jgi:phospholipid/cholesterol/gamma-HCH transport system ATP-binding protein
MIKVEGLTKSFGRQKVLRELSLDVATGTITIVIGRSGGGKSVFLKHLIGLLRPDAGRIMVEGVDISRLRGRDLDAIRRTYGVVFQGGALFDSMSCFDNVAFPLREKVRTPPDELTKRVEAALGQVGLEGVGPKYPAEISGGMRKRVGLARAIVGEPQILLYDEPVTGLDPVNAAAVDRLIADIAERTHVTSIVVTHDVEGGLSISDRVALLEGGKLRFLGTPEEFRRSEDALVRAFADRQAAVEAALAGSARSSRIADARTAALR